MSDPLQNGGRWEQYNSFWDSYAAQLSSTARCVWCALFRHAYSDGKAYRTRSQLASILNSSTVTISAAIKELKEAKLIEKSKGMNGYTILILNGGTVKKTLLESKENLTPTTVKKTLLESKENLTPTTVKKTLLESKENLTGELRKLNTLQNNRILQKRNTQQPQKAAGDIDSNSEEISKPKKENAPKQELKNHPRWLNWALHLKKSIESTRKVNSQSKVSSWADSFCKLHTVDGYPIEKIKTVLKWYCQQWERQDWIVNNSEFMPIAMTGKAFREKFVKIESAMHRLEQKRNPAINPDTHEKLRIRTCQYTGDTVYFNTKGEEVKRERGETKKD